ncbi:hypothetical protein E2562_006405 [Oryza meyeriana var. granulata]|uniref:Uncharacterized protein n=1 Tax=Oryza meyeriana var. granulata TaxID=110450 RepID=A0A6G1EFR4_9ORYZ|nr:hypothetical protein E2562_006405 [Oryza meyeriana var. granulata]
MGWDYGRVDEREHKERPRVPETLAAVSRGWRAAGGWEQRGTRGVGGTAGRGPGAAAVPNPNPSQRPIGIGVMGSGDLLIWLLAGHGSSVFGCGRMPAGLLGQSIAWAKIWLFA